MKKIEVEYKIWEFVIPKEIKIFYDLRLFFETCYNKIGDENWIAVSNPDEKFIDDCLVHNKTYGVEPKHLRILAYRPKINPQKTCTFCVNYLKCEKITNIEKGFKKILVEDSKSYLFADVYSFSASFCNDFTLNETFRDYEE